MKYLIPLLIVLLSACGGSVWGATFGIEATHTISAETGDTWFAGAFTSNGTGTIDIMSVYLDISAQPCSVKLAIYLVSASNDTTLVDTSEKKDVPVGAAWTDFDMLMDSTVYQDSIYYLVCRAEDVPGGQYMKFYNPASCSADPDPVTNCPWAFRTMPFANVWPSTMSNTTKSNYRELSIHCDYTPTVTAAGAIIIIQTE